MNKYMNFSTQFYPLINKLKKWVSNEFYPSIKNMKSTKTGAFRFYTLSLNNNNNNLKILKKDGTDISTFSQIVTELEHFDKKAGIYGVCISINNQSAFIYTGKSKDLKTRVRQHLTGKNLDGVTPIAQSVSHKYDDIFKLVNNNLGTIIFFIWTSKKLTKSSDIDYELGVLEALFIAESKEDFDNICQINSLSLEHWNLRVG